ncbi:DNA-directed RNA polymerase V subunit 7-like [Andrographis paniculata]|uniref:DNA-directed RNA polymerase V subunit 7-like n=1 Tax=Andrographis paniculata TaxID=175694 RepID=UPI0021E94079|nr:DNA-directed RNA polymerase V subunit 7-like [Andrographis paniculata]XP_051130433.1 DNA-directed RNA polymerase V subunit 7-like [Andrographis paniculata]XP_051130441.1 DNA-directed RNA polymerase V subunit 7-like [Andrographis paniculata]
MYIKSKLSWNVVLPAGNLNVEGLMLQKAIITRLTADFAAKKATKDLGYFLAVTTVGRIGEGRVRQQSGDVLFPVEFTCVTFKMLPKEVLDGTVYQILKHGVFLRCGPIEKVFLSHQKMDDYQYVSGENPHFMNNKSSKIEKGSVVRFMVIGQKYMEAEKDFQALVSLEGDYLGPISYPE